MNIKKVRELRKEALNQELVKKVARDIAQKSGLEVDEVVRFLRRFWYKLTVELETKGEADFLGVGKLIINKENPKGGWKLIRYSEEEISRKRQLKLQQQFGGELGSVGEPLEDDVLDIVLDATFPLDVFLERLAEYRNVPAEQLKKKYQAQLEKAYKEMVETGSKGILPDFGVISFANAEMTEVKFNLNEEVMEFLKKQVE